MDWNSGYSATYYASFVDPDTWEDLGRFDIVGGSIKRTLDELRESADIDCVGYSETKEKWIRIWLDAKQTGSSSRIALFTGLATSPKKEIDGRLISNSLECYSILKPAQDILLDRGWYAPIDIDVRILFKELLSVTNAPLILPEKEYTLKSAVIAEQGETNLSMVNLLLDVANWRLSIDGRGAISITEYDSNPKIQIDSLYNDIVEPNISIDYDWYDCPNVFRAILDDTCAIVKDDDENSPFSTVNRGREVWVEERSVTLNDDETIADYAARRLLQLQQVSTLISYDRRYIPNVLPSDVIYLNYPEQKIVGKYMITSQAISLGHNCTTSEEAIKV